VVGGGSMAAYSPAVASRTRAACKVGGVGAEGGGDGQSQSEAAVAEQLAALHKRHIYDTSVLLQKEREMLALASRKGSTTSVSYLASLGKLLQQKAGMVTRLLQLLPSAEASPHR
jgi:hypothetical protein